jgi:hypothetical protein
VERNSTDQAAPFDLSNSCEVNAMVSIEFRAFGPYRHPLGQKICKTDRKWFRAHSLRQHYVRRMLCAEFSEALPGEQWYVAVRQVRPGIRMRRGFQWFGEPPPEDLFEGEEVSKIIFDLLNDTPGQFISGADLKGRVLSKLMATVPPEGSA